jgi:hypothetical protein
MLVSASLPGDIGRGNALPIQATSVARASAAAVHHRTASAIRRSPGWTTFRRIGAPVRAFVRGETHGFTEPVAQTWGPTIIGAGASLVTVEVEYRFTRRERFVDRTVHGRVGTGETHARR